jgi:hypothetical protein
MTDETVAPRFDVDKSTAALVLQHVNDLRDRMALASTFRVWREAATAPAACRDRLVIEGSVAARLTDERMVRLLSSYAGPNLRSLEVHDAPRHTFTGRGLLRGPTGQTYDENRFPELQTLTINQCPCVRAVFIREFLTGLDILDREKKDRLDRLSLAGCTKAKCDMRISDGLLATLDTFVRHARDANLPFSKGHFDLWPCVHCRRVIDEGLQCFDCTSVACQHHAETGPGVSICNLCDAYVCLSTGCGAGDQERDECIGCGVEFCDPCAHSFENAIMCQGSDTVEGCYQVKCDDCNDDGKYYLCSGHCGAGFWCFNCVPENFLTCQGTG